jgi:hypothetical protein
MELGPWLDGEPGRKGVIDVEDWAEIRRLHRAPGLSIKAIARRLKVARNTVRDALRSDEPPRYERLRMGSAVDAVEPRIRELLAEFPTMPATVIAERVGWERGITILRDRVAELRPLFVPPDPCQRGRSRRRSRNRDRHRRPPRRYLRGGSPTPFRLAATAPRLHWQVELSTRCNYRRLQTDLPAALLGLEQAGIAPSVLTPLASFDGDPNGPTARIRRLGVVALACRIRGALDDVGVTLFPQSVEFGGQETWDTFDGELARILARGDLADVRTKLRANDYDERHLFLGLTMASPECFHFWLSPDQTALPDCAPHLPHPISHVWLWSSDVPGQRVLAWFPDCGWFDPSLKWATA